ncbi:tyrosine-type recombinase/integrase [Lachnospiraceae bacterium MD329]|nr:tyrosine-type recombinase/integrase [Lachnospiraceae bacterium MD329]
MVKITLDMIYQYKSHLISEEKSKATIEKYIHDLLVFYEWLENGLLTKSKALEYKAVLTEKYAPASVNSVLASLNGFFAYNEWFDLKIKNLKIQRKIFCQSERELTKSEYERLLKAARNKKNNRIYLVMQTICSTGIRVSELKFITTDAVQTGRTAVKLKGKIRTILLPKELCRLLKEYIREKNIESGSVFVTKTGKPIDRHGIWKDMKALCESAGVAKEKVFPHNLRHLFARTYYTLQKDIEPFPKK